MYERLTGWDKGNAYLRICFERESSDGAGCEDMYSDKCLTCPDSMEMFRRLAAYEDSGLSPDEVQELAQAKAEGRLVVLPVKVGDTVYIAVKEWDARYCLKSSFVPCIRKGTVAHICISHKGIVVCVNVKGDYSEYYEFGKTVFLTREEAEKALERQEAR